MRESPKQTATYVVRPIPYAEPLDIFAALSGDGMAVLLESAGPGPDTGRYSAVACDPALVLKADWPNAFERLGQLWNALPKFASPEGWPIGPGLFGSFGYELRCALERLPSRHAREDEPDDLLLGLFDTVIVFDHAERRAAVIAGDLVAGRPPALLRAETIATRAIPILPPVDWTGEAEWIADRTPQDYAAGVGKVLDYILAGDIYQANFTQRWIAARPAGLQGVDFYRRLRALSPAPYAALIQDGAGQAIVAASPERFLRLTPAGRIDTRPIKGTRGRGATEAEDRALAAALVDSAKDRAENLMIVDLLRNDLGRVAETGSVTVPELNALYSFASVHHLVSTVTAQLRRGLTPVDLIRASFPGGSITGTPKIRAMEIIDELEAGRRGAYCGAIGWIGLDGAMELSIAIRTLTLTQDRIIAQAGGGIVADSDPMGEYREALTKARPMLATLDPRYR
ncbi:MAG TPA: aminodeoxychorismate synthase component I [Alphaproteobacteria bacterium]|jgi:para-aminobenzoate synthetase component 1|nr:aminodeoxychorismate synthase component I [Alphaproteobacteria bacterium]